MQGHFENGRQAAAETSARRFTDVRLAAASAAEERAVVVMAAHAEKVARDKDLKERLESAKQLATKAYHALHEVKPVLREVKEKLMRGQQQLTLGRLGNPELQADLEKEVKELKSRVMALEMAKSEYEKELSDARRVVSEIKEALGIK